MGDRARVTVERIEPSRQLGPQASRIDARVAVSESMPYCHDAREIVRESRVDEGVACQQFEALSVGRGNAPPFVGDNVKCHVDRLLDRDEQAHGKRVLAVDLRPQQLGRRGSATADTLDVLAKHAKLVQHEAGVRHAVGEEPVGNASSLWRKRAAAVPNADTKSACSRAAAATNRENS